MGTPNPNSILLAHFSIIAVRLQQMRILKRENVKDFQKKSNFEIDFSFKFLIGLIDRKCILDR